MIIVVFKIFSFLPRHKTETDEPVLRLCTSHHSESVVVQLINGNLYKYSSGIKYKMPIDIRRHRCSILVQQCFDI